MTESTEAAEMRRDYGARGFYEIERAPRNAEIKPGARVHNRGEQWAEAERFGTATVVAVLRKGTDERPDSWERSYGRPNVEVIVERDMEKFGSRGAVWADYGTFVAHDYIADIDAAFAARQGA